MKQMSKSTKTHHQTQPQNESLSDVVQEISVHGYQERLQGQSVLARIGVVRESFPIGPPAEYAASWRHAGKSFARDLRALTLLATTSWSIFIIA